MGSFSLWHWLVVIILVLLLFGRGRISDLMGDLGKGLKSFKQGIAEDDKPDERARDQRSLPPQGQPPERPIDVTPEPRRDSDSPRPPTDDRTGA